IQVALEVAVDAYPVHLPAARYLDSAHNGYVVFSLARDHTGIATDAGVQVDRHAPGVPRTREPGIQRQIARRLGLARKAGIALIFRDRARPDQAAVLHAVVVLRAGRQMTYPRLAQDQAGPEPRL